MLSRLAVKNFTVFREADFAFGDLNIVHGENGAGKTHVLKLAYSAWTCLHPGRTSGAGEHPTHDWLDAELGRKLVGVFRPTSVGRLARRVQGQTRAEVSLSFADPEGALRFHFSTRSAQKVSCDAVPSAWLPHGSVYLPPREALSVFPGFVNIYDTANLALDETWRDLALMLDVRRTVGQPRRDVKALLDPIEQALGGSLVLDDHGFSLRMPNGKMEIDLVAEGLRKLATVAWLVANDRLQRRGSLFWDEPEANLNPRLIRSLAPVVVGLARRGVQVFVATHSLFLIRELVVARQAQASDLAVRFIGLHPGDDGVEVRQGADIADSTPLAALDESSAQTGRYLQAMRGSA